MLILSRKFGESIVVADDIFIRILEVSGNRVRLGIEAPQDISIHRSEAWRPTVGSSTRVLVAEACGT